TRSRVFAIYARIHQTSWPSGFEDSFATKMNRIFGGLSLGGQRHYHLLLNAPKRSHGGRAHGMVLQSGFTPNILSPGGGVEKAKNRHIRWKGHGRRGAATRHGGLESYRAVTPCLCQIRHSSALWMATRCQ
ncbi:unnamed protein product, partial [Scytosiphon promiscuus]